MNAGASGGCVKQDAGEWTGMICDSGTLVGRKIDRGIGVARGDDGESLGRDDGAQTLREGEGHILFDRIVREVGAGIWPAVGWIEEDEIAVEGREGFG